MTDRRSSIASLVLLSLLATPAAALPDLPTTPAGLWALVGDVDPAAAVALARAGDRTLYVQVPDAPRADAVRAAAEAAGVLGKTLFVDRAPADRLALADNLADVVIWRPVPGGPQPADAELLRAVRPGGKAFLDVGKPVLDTRQLTKPVPDGLDPWSHPYHGPDNNPLSRDRLARAPYVTQFLAEPLFSSQPEVTVAAGGRLFKAFGHMTFRAYQNPSINTLLCLSAYNGSLVWKRELKEGFMIHRNTIIATPDVLYMADNESCKLLDAATGKIVDQIPAPAEAAADGKVWKWMALDNGILYALIGGEEVQAPVAKGTATAIGGWPWGMWPGYDYKDPKTAWGFGRHLVALDLKTRKPLWTRHETDYLDARGLCMHGGRLYTYSPDKSLACLDAATGKDVWRTNDETLLKVIGPNQKAQHYVTGFATSAYIKSNGKVVTFAGPQRQALVAVDAANGKLLWKRSSGNFQLVLRDDALFALGDQFGKSFKFDYMSGEVLAEFVGRRACTRATGSLDSVFCRAREGTLRWDVATNATQHIAPMRPACHDGVIVSEGMLHWGPWICGCHLTLVGAIGLAPANDFDFAARYDEARQLESAPAPAGRAVARFESHANDWPAFGRDARQSRRTPVKVPDKVAVRWEYKPAAPTVPTAPIAAGGQVVFATADGSVRALDAAGGTPRWQARTGGSIFFPPALANGRLFVGSNDGHVYALEAATGAELWRFRAAPVERKIPVYGEVMSAWPVAGGVVTGDGQAGSDNTVYAAAGISHFDATHVYALDAATGRVRWHNNASGSLDPEVKNGVSLCGPLHLEGTTLSFPGGNVYPVAGYDTATGKCTNQPAGAKTSRRIFLFPRKLWEPIIADDLPTPAGLFRVTPLRGGRPDNALGGQPVALSLGGQPDRKPAPDARPIPDPRARPAWSIPAVSYHGAILAGDTLLVLARYKEKEADRPAPTHLTALNPADGKQLWSHPLPSTPVHNGLAMDAGARIYVTLEDGRVLCFAGPAAE